MTKFVGTALWDAAEAARATGGWNTKPWKAKGVSIDSRTLVPGELFVALVGARMDGHDYIADAYRAGAAAAMVSRPIAADTNILPQLVVADTKLGLTSLGVVGRERSQAHFIAITGSTGKTGTKEMLRLALSRIGNVHASLQSYNNAIGVPLTLANMPKEADYAVVELGMSNKGEIAELTKIARPHVGIITNVGTAHLENFQNVQEIAKAKAEIFGGLEPGGIAVLNHDDVFYETLAEYAQEKTDHIITFGSGGNVTLQLTKYEAAQGMNILKVKIDNCTIRYQLGVDGIHWAHNFLAVLGAIKGIKKNPKEFTTCLSKYRGINGRGLRHSVKLSSGEIELIDDSYNANPSSMSAALKLLVASQPKPKGRKVAVIGDMLELGDASEYLHDELFVELISSNIDAIFSVGPHMSRLCACLPALQHGSHADLAPEIIPPLLSFLGPNDVVLVKGSNGTNMGCIVEAIINASDNVAEDKCEGFTDVI